jgi:hypothetical protein
MNKLNRIVRSEGDETMNYARKILRAAVGITVVLIPAACSNSSSGGTTANPQLSFTPQAAMITDGMGHTLQTFVPPGDKGPNTFTFSISGEVNAIAGYPYPPFDPSQTWMVDGWNWKIEKYIVVVDHITLWNNPNESPSNQELHGSQVAQVNGPWVVDLHKGGPIDGKGGGGEEALAIANLVNQNSAGNAAFDPSTTYAFGFSTVPAPSDGSAINVNLTSDEQADYQYMVQKGASVYYYGTAQWAGNQGGQSGFGLCSTNPQTDLSSGNQTCATASSGAGDGGLEGGSGDDGGLPSTCPNAYNFAQLPQSMTFQFAFSTPTNYVNCVNYTVSEQLGMDVRGVQTSTSQTQIEQVTVHMDHPFWESFEEDTPVHWDQIAAQYIGMTNPTAHLEDLIGVPFNPFTDQNGTVMPWHWCETAYTPPGNGAMSFSTLSVPQNPHGTCTGTVGQDFTLDNCTAIRDYYDFIRYTQSTQGHLNSQGLCYIDRQFPAPAGGS